MPIWNCNTCGIETDPRMCGEWNCCKDHAALTGEDVHAVEKELCNNCGQYAEMSDINEFGNCKFCSPTKAQLTAKDDQYYMREQARLRSIIGDASQPDVQRKAAQAALRCIPSLYRKHRGTITGTMQYNEKGEIVL